MRTLYEVTANGSTVYNGEDETRAQQTRTNWKTRGYTVEVLTVEVPEIIEAEPTFAVAEPAATLTRKEALKIVWRHTHRDFRGRNFGTGGSDKCVLILRAGGTCSVRPRSADECRDRRQVTDRMARRAAPHREGAVMNRGKGFERGGLGVYSCKACGHRTRYTGAQSIGSELCEDCWEIAGIYNVHQDGGDLTGYAAEIRERCARITARGGTLDSDALELLELIKPKTDPLAMADSIREHAPELAMLLPAACFALETVAHLQGQEKVLLPITEKLRAILAGTAVKS